MFLKKFPDFKIFSLILAENPLFSPDFPDWKKSSKFSLNSLIGGNPDLGKLFHMLDHSKISLEHNYDDLYKVICISHPMKRNGIMQK